MRVLRPGESEDVLSTHLARAGIVRRELACTTSVFAALYLAQANKALVSVPVSVYRLLGERFHMQPVDEPFAPLKVPVHLCWHRALDRDEGHLWLRERLIASANAGDAAAGPAD